jgi:hypothetical protein
MADKDILKAVKSSVTKTITDIESIPVTRVFGTMCDPNAGKSPKHETPRPLSNRPRTVSNEVSYKFNSATTDKRVS